MAYKARHHLHIRYLREGQLFMSLCIAPWKLMLTFKQMKNVGFSFQCSCSIFVITYLVWNGIYNAKKLWRTQTTSSHNPNQEHRRSNCPASSEIAAPVWSAQPSSRAHTNPDSRGEKQSSINVNSKISLHACSQFCFEKKIATQHSLPAPLHSRLALGSAATSTSTGRGKGQLF